MTRDLLPVEHVDPVPLLEPTLNRMARFAEASTSMNTKRAYRGDWKVFSTWCRDRGLSSMPASPETLALFLTAQAESGLKTSTIGRRMASVSQAHQLAQHASPAMDARVRVVWQGICRELGRSPEKKKALPLSDLKAIVLSCEHDLHGTRDKAMLLLGFMGAMRRSELVNLDVEDIQMEEDQGLRIRIRRSKSDQEGQGREIGIPVGKSHTTCPVLALRAYLAAAKIEGGPLFRPMHRWGSLRRTRLTPQSVAKVIKRRMKALGLDPADYGGHSLRSGFVTAAARAGVAEHAIARQSGHKSVAVLRGYIQTATLFQGNPASALDL